MSLLLFFISGDDTFFAQRITLCIFQPVFFFFVFCRHDAITQRCNGGDPGAFLRASLDD